MKALDDVKPVIAVGDKVRLKYDAITKSPDYDRRVENYKKFVEDSKDKVFTTESYKGYNKLFCFVEDETEVKWVFHEYDLEKVEENDECSREKEIHKRIAEAGYVAERR